MISSFRELAEPHTVGKIGLTVHGRHDESDLSRIGGTREMGINLLCLMLIQ